MMTVTTTTSTVDPKLCMLFGFNRNLFLFFCITTREIAICIFFAAENSGMQYIRMRKSVAVCLAVIQCALDRSS